MTDKFIGNILYDSGLQDEPPLFDWERLLPDADDIIARVRQPWSPPAAKDLRPDRPGTDLLLFREDIAHLLANAHEIYLVARDDYEARNSADRPPRWGDEGAKQAEAQLVDDETFNLFVHDAAACIDGSWGKLWDHYYGRKRGNPGASRTGGPPLPPARQIYQMVGAWWRKRKLSEFNPRFANGDDEAHHDPASRFLLAVLQSVEPGYTAAHARGLYETDRKARSKRARKKE